MTEKSEKIKPPASVEYLKVPMPQPGDAAEARPLGVSSIEESSGDLITAAQTVLRVFTRKIAYHEDEARKLRATLELFAAATRRPSEAPAGELPADALQAALLKFAEEHKGEV